MFASHLRKWLGKPYQAGLEDCSQKPDRAARSRTEQPPALLILPLRRLIPTASQHLMGLLSIGNQAGSRDSNKSSGTLNAIPFPESAIYVSLLQDSWQSIAALF